MFDMFMAWQGGATLESTPAYAFLALPEFIERKKMTVWFSVPSAISVVRRRGGLSPGSMPSLRWSLFCGEALMRQDAEDWQQAASQSVLENLYGPTELTIACSTYRWMPEQSPSRVRERRGSHRHDLPVVALRADRSVRAAQPRSKVSCA